MIDLPSIFSHAPVRRQNEAESSLHNLRNKDNLAETGVSGFPRSASFSLQPIKLYPRSWPVVVAIGWYRAH